MNDVQIGDVFIKHLAGNEDTAARRFRVIMPIGYNMMVRFDVAVSLGMEIASLRNTLFYKRGDKEQEELALNGKS